MLAPTRNPLLRKLQAVAKRDALTLTRGSMGLGMRFIFVAAELATFYFLSRSVGPTFRPEGMDYFWFLLTGTAAFELLLASIHALIRSLRDAQISGMLEVLLATSTSAVVVILLDSLSTLIGKIAHTMVYLTLGVVLFGIALPHPHWAATISILVLSIMISLALGLVAASVQIWLQKGDSAVALMSALAALLSGVLFPVDVLPPALRGLANLNPLTHALTGFRASALKGASWSDLSSTFIVLGVYCCVLVPFGVWLFDFALRRARRNGTLLFY